MKLDPGFTNHWKTELLIDRLGGDGVVAVLRLWGAAQIRRRFTGLEFTPKRLAMETKWKGDENLLFAVLTDTDAPWLDKDADGTFTIHGFSEHQHQVVKLWENGKKGGRPKKVSPTPSSSSSSSSSSPICEPNGNHMVSESFALNGASSASSPKISWSQSAGFAGITDQDRESWAKAYPAVNLERQLAAANEWLRSNPAKAKKSQWRKFITGWMTRAQDRGGDIPSNRNQQTTDDGGVVVNGRVFKP